MEPHKYIPHVEEFTRITLDEFANVVKNFGATSASGNLPSTLTERLQIFDIITQRLHNLVETHERVMTLYICDIFKESFLHLQYFQFSIIEFDLFQVLSGGDQHLNAGMKSPDDQHKEYLLSGNVADLAVLAQKIKEILKENAGDAKFLKLPALTTRQITICKQLYTMERERVVLDWFVKNSVSDFSDLLQTYQSWLKNYNGAAIELFDNV